MTENLVIPTEVDLRVDLDPKHVRLELAYAGEGLSGGEKSPVGAFL